MIFWCLCVSGRSFIVNLWDFHNYFNVCILKFNTCIYGKPLTVNLSNTNNTLILRNRCIHLAIFLHPGLTYFPVVIVSVNTVCLSHRSDIMFWLVSVCWLTVETVKADQSLTVLELDSGVTRVNPLAFLQWLQTIGTLTSTLSTSDLRWEGFRAHTSVLLWRALVDSVLFTFSRLSLFPFPIFTVAVWDSEGQFAQLVRPLNG